VQQQDEKKMRRGRSNRGRKRERGLPDQKLWGCAHGGIVGAPLNKTKHDPGPSSPARPPRKKFTLQKPKDNFRGQRAITRNPSKEKRELISSKTLNNKTGREKNGKKSMAVLGGRLGRND